MPIVRDYVHAHDDNGDVSRTFRSTPTSANPVKRARKVAKKDPGSKRPPKAGKVTGRESDYQEKMCRVNFYGRSNEGEVFLLSRDGPELTEDQRITIRSDVIKLVKKLYEYEKINLDASDFKTKWTEYGYGTLKLKRVGVAYDGLQSILYVEVDEAGCLMQVIGARVDVPVLVVKSGRKTFIEVVSTDDPEGAWNAYNALNVD